MKKRAFYLIFFIILLMQFNYANADKKNLDLQSALKRIQFAKTHYGYTFDQMEKCLFPYIATITDNWKNMPLMMRQSLLPMFQRPDNPDSYWYVSGLPKTFGTPHFKFHYTTQGPDAVISEDISPLNGIPDLVDICAEAFEKSYRIEVEQLGYKSPIDDMWAKDNGGDRRYDVYLFSGPWLGFTMPEDPLSVQSTAITASFYFGINSRVYELVGASEGKRYIETTCCHEFFHSIQFAYNYRSERWFMESTCTWMERIVYDGSEQGETNGNNYYTSQLNYWFRYPDWSLTRFDGWHEYGSVIWSIFLTERYDVEIIKDIFENMAEGTYRELANFNEAFTGRGTNLGSAFKEFAVWNYFTNFRYDDRFYSYGATYPPVPVHLDDVISKYPMKTYLDTEKAPENLGTRYIRFLPSEKLENITIKIDGSDITDSQDIQYLNAFGTRGWGAKLIIYQKDRKPRVDEIMLFPRSQEGQRTYSNFGKEIEEIVLVLSNLHPDLDIYSVSFSAGQPPIGRLSEPKVNKNDKGEIVLSWEVLDISGIKDVAIVRKRFAPSERDQDDSEIKVYEVYSAQDIDGNNISDDNIDIIGKVSATDTTFIDKTVFSDVDMQYLSDPESVHYYYAIVPLSEYGIMGTPSIAKNPVTPTMQAPMMSITTEYLAPGEWLVYLNSTKPLSAPPQLIAITPDQREIPVKLSKWGDDTRWQGRLLVDFKVPSGTYSYIASAKDYYGIVGTYIIKGAEFQYKASPTDQSLICYPNPFNGIMKFRPPGFDIKIYSISGKLIRTLHNAEEWDGKDDNGYDVVSGTYIYVAEKDGFQTKGKIVVIR